MIAKLRKLKAHAESAAKIGNEAEAQAFAAMFQQLLLKHKLGLTDIEFDAEAAQEKIERHWVDWETHEVRVRKNRVLWIEQLASIVARAYFCRIIVLPGSSNIELIGETSHVEVAEYVLVTLVRLADRMSKLERDKVYRRDRAAADGFRQSFLNGFINRLAVRLKEELAQAVRDAGPASSTALVRVNRSESAVTKYMDELKKSKSIKNASRIQGGRRRVNAEGYARGQEVANGMDIRGRAVKPGDARRDSARLTS
jgi:hypothetical protein